MKASLFVVAAAALFGLMLTAPRSAHAGQVYVDLHIGVPAVVLPPGVIYEPVVVYRPRVVTPAAVVYYHPHRYYRHHGPVFYRGYDHELRGTEVPIERRW